MIAQKVEQRQKRQAEDGEKVALDPVEQLSAQAFQLVGTDGFTGFAADLCEIVIDEVRAEGRMVSRASSM